MHQNNVMINFFFTILAFFTILGASVVKFISWLIHERALRVTCGGRTSSFRCLLGKDKLIPKHHRNIQCLVVEIFEGYTDIPSLNLEGFFTAIISPYGLCHGSAFERWRVLCLAWYWINIVFRSKNLRPSTRWNKAI